MKTMFWKMPSIQLKIWKSYVYFSLILCLNPMVSSFPKEKHSLDSKFESEIKEGTFAYKETRPDITENADCMCDKGKCEKEDGKLICKCPPEYGLYTSSICKECNCGKGSNCTFEGYGFLELKTRKHCTCKEGYKEVNEKCVVSLCKKLKREIQSIENGVIKCGECWESYIGKEGEECFLETCINTEVSTCKELKRQCSSIVIGVMKCGECFENHVGKEGEECILETCENTEVSTCKESKRQCSSIVNGVMECGECFENHVGKEGEECILETCENTELSKCKDLKRKCKSIWNGVMECGECLENHLEKEGEVCFLDPCSRDPCKNNGICKVENESFICFCRQPYYGYTCEEDSCSNNPCMNNGICKMENENFVCFCRYPFYGDTCDKDYNTSTFDPTVLFSTTSPVIEYTRNISFETTNEPSTYYNLTTEMWNTTSESTIPSYEPSTDYNATAEPSGFTLDFNVTSEVFDNFTNSYNQTFEPWNTTVEYSTTEESSNHTLYFTTVELPFNETVDFNQTSETPLDFTVDYNKTTDFKDNLNITTALPPETTSVDGLSTSVTASTSRPLMYIFRNVYTIQNLTEVVVKT